MGIRTCFEQQQELRDEFRRWRMEDRLKGYSPKESGGLMDEAGVEMVLIAAAKMCSFRTHGLI